MNNEILIAIITSGVSLLVSAGSLVASVIISRQSAHSAEIVESLRFRLEKRKSTEVMGDEYLKQNIKSLDVLIQAIQQMKDIVQLILNAGGSNMDSESAKKSISKARQLLFKSYEEQLPNLDEGSNKGAHQAKDIALRIETSLFESLKRTSFVSELSDKDKQALLELRNDLTNAQNLLRDSKATLLFNRIQANE